MKVKGAIYIPTRAYNAYQMYEDFNASEIDRDFSYAEKAGLNSLRIFSSYEQCLKNKEVFYSKFEKMLEIADSHHLKVMPVLLENCGVPFSEEAALSSTLKSAFCIQSPGREITDNPSLWEEPFAYAVDFVKRYADDKRLIAIEVMNEPHMETGDVQFGLELIKRCTVVKGNVPLTIGCINLDDSLFFIDYLDVIQFHDNFPVNLDDLKNKLQKAELLQKLSGKPVWFSEWQRHRSVTGWRMPTIPEEDVPPQLSSLADIVYSTELGSFFWSLMVKPAYLPEQRINGTYNGLFYEDGSVFSIEDYRAISGNDPEPGVKEKREFPSWAK